MATRAPATAVEPGTVIAAAAPLVAVLEADEVVLVVLVEFLRVMVTLVL